MTLKIYDDLEQGSEEWLEARRGILTASVIGKLITPTLKVANNDTSRALLRTIVAERITNYVEPVYVSRDMENGHFVEPYVRDFYTEHHADGQPVTEVGFMTRTFTNGDRLGYSPDGLVGDTGLIEMKSRKGHIQLDAFTTADYGVPNANMAQIQTGLLVTGRDWCDYVAYSGDMPLYIHRVTPDPAWQDTIRATLETFEQQATALHNVYTKTTAGLPIADRVLNDELMNLEF